MSNPEAPYGPLLARDVALYQAASERILAQTVILPKKPEEYEIWTTGHGMPLDYTFLVAEQASAMGYEVAISHGDDPSVAPWFDYSVPPGQRPYIEGFEAMLGNARPLGTFLYYATGGGFAFMGETESGVTIVVPDVVKQELEQFSDNAKERRTLLRRGFMTNLIADQVYVELAASMTPSRRENLRATAEEMRAYEKLRTNIAPLGFEEIDGLMRSCIEAAMRD